MSLPDNSSQTAATMQWEAEVSANQEALRRNPNDVVAHYNLGLALDTLGQCRRRFKSIRPPCSLTPI